MRVVAIDNFHPLGLARPVRPGEVLEAADDLALEWIRLGLVRTDEARTDEATEKAIRAPEVQAVKAPDAHFPEAPASVLPPSEALLALLSVPLLLHAAFPRTIPMNERPMP